MTLFMESDKNLLKLIVQDEWLLKPVVTDVVDRLW